MDYKVTYQIKNSKGIVIATYKTLKAAEKNMGCGNRLVVVKNLIK